MGSLTQTVTLRRLQANRRYALRQGPGARGQGSGKEELFRFGILPFTFRLLLSATVQRSQARGRGFGKSAKKKPFNRSQEVI